MMILKRKKIRIYLFTFGTIQDNGMEQIFNETRLGQIFVPKEIKGQE